MNTRARRLAMVTAMLWFGFGGGGRVQAAPLPLPTPAGLKNDQPFRFVFVTDGTTNAFSDNIADYNSFASSQAAGATYNGKPIAWTAIASTTTVNAITNIPGAQTAPVYLPKGQLVATNTTTGKDGLWSTGPKTTLMNAINQDVFGEVQNSFTVWTGTKPDGTTQGKLNALGAPSPETGLSASKDASWVASGTIPNNRTQEHMYSISEVLTAVVPEPTSLVMAGTGISAVFAYGWFRRRRDQRRQRPVGSPDAM